MSGYEQQVREYLDDCARLKDILDPKYHPSEAGVVKVVYGDAQMIRQAYRKITGNEA